MKTANKVILASLIGNILEWYDFALFGIFATIFAHNFFPAGNQAAALMGSFGILAVGYFMRPIGGAIIGHMGDRLSRRIALIISLLTMGGVTTVIGLLPTYATAGIWATALLILLRMAQGFAVGGEFPGSMVIIGEQARPDRRAFAIGLALSGALVGVLLGSGIASVLSSHLDHNQMQNWGWRLPFLIGIVLAAIGLYIRTKLWQESDFAANKETSLPILDIIKKYKLSMLKALCLLAPAAVSSGILTVFLVTYLTHYLGISHDMAYKILFFATLIPMIVFPFAALIADHYNIHRKWLLYGLVILSISIYPLFALMQHGTALCFLAVVLLLTITFVVFGPFTPILIDLFPKEVRCSGVSIVHGLVFSIIAGTAPLFGNWLVLHFGVLSPSYYFIITVIFAWVAVYYSK